MRFQHPELIVTWPFPNYVNPVTRGPALYVINSIAFVLAVIAVASRLSVRLFVRKWLGPDDGFILLALVSLLALYQKNISTENNSYAVRVTWVLSFGAFAFLAGIATCGMEIQRS
jgi:hypothetical protein